MSSNPSLAFGELLAGDLILTRSPTGVEAPRRLTNRPDVPTKDGVAHG